MELWDVFENRRTIRKFSAPPSAQQLKRLLKAGSMAPSAGNKQTWFVVIVKDPATREKLGDIKRALNATWTPDTKKGHAMLDIQKDVFNNSMTVMVYTYAPEPTDPNRSDMGSAWLFVENFCLAALPEGLGTQLCGYSGDAVKKVDRLLKVPKKYLQVIGINVGVPHPDYKPLKKVYKPVSKWIFKERWPAK